MGELLIEAILTYRRSYEGLQPFGMGEHTDIALEGERGERRAQHLLNDFWIGSGDTAIAVDGDALPKKLDLDLIRVFHDIAYIPSLRMHTLSGAIAAQGLSCPRTLYDSGLRSYQRSIVSQGVN